MPKLRSSKCVSAITLVCLLLICGCESMQGVFAKPQLLRYRRLMVLGLEPEKEQILMACYINTFHEQSITFVERSNLRQVISEQDLLEGRLDDDTRANVRKILGVEAIMLCHYAYDRLRVRIVDSETGAIVGSAVTQNYVYFEDHACAVAKALKAYLRR